VLAYLATKSEFLRDAVGIEDVVRDAVRDQLGLTIGKDSAEYASWRNSLGNAMFHVLNSPLIPGDVGVAIEYRLKESALKVDRDGTLAKTDQLIRNTYRTLLTRGMRGTFIYCTNEQTREFFKKELELARAMPQTGPVTRFSRLEK
jgi:hypothetical protein